MSGVIVKPVRLAKVGNRIVYGTGRGIRVGAAGKTQDAGKFYGRIPKGEARKVRKAAFAAGMIELARAKREPDDIGF